MVPKVVIIHRFNCTSVMISMRQISYCKTHPFADDINFLFCYKPLKNKYISHNLPKIVQWLRENKISLNASKTEIILFQPE